MRKTHFLGREVPLYVAVGTLALFPFLGLLLGLTVGFLSNRSENVLPDPPPKVKQSNSNILPAGEDVVSSSDSFREPPKEYHPGGVSYLPVDNEYDLDKEQVDSNEEKVDSNFLTAGEEVVSSYSPGGESYETTLDEQKKWYNISLIEWAKRSNEIKRYNCATCKKRFSDGEISVIEENLLEVKNNKEYIEYKFGVKCDCGHTHTVTILGHRDVKPVIRRSRKKEDAQFTSRAAISYGESKNSK